MEQNPNPMISAGAEAPNWKLPLVLGSDSLSLEKLKGETVLLEFWMKNCGYCIAAVPGLNALSEKYEAKRFRIVGVNAHDNRADISFFYQRHHPSYNTVQDNGAITSAYGISDFPAVVLIDKKGVVVYAGAFNEDIVDRLVSGALT